MISLSIGHRVASSFKRPHSRSWTARSPRPSVRSITTSPTCSSPRKVFVLGDNVEAQLGVLGTACEKPTPIENLPDISCMACGHLHTLLVDVHGGVWSFGASTFGETGLGVDLPLHLPERINLNAKIVAASAGKAHSLLLSDDGKVYSFGDGESNQLGYQAPGGNGTPRMIEALKGVNVRQIVSGALHNLVIDDQGNAYSWGSGNYAQHGQGVVDAVLKPMLVSSLSTRPIRFAAAGLYHTVVVTESDEVLFFGGHKTKTLGANLHRTQFFLNPTPVKNLTIQPGEKWTHLTAGITHNVISTNKGRTFAWGINTGFSVGSNDAFFDRAEQLHELDGKVLATLSSGSYHNMASDMAGGVWGWGQGSDFQLGTGRRSPEKPTRLELELPPSSKILQIAAGWAHTALLVEL